MNRRRSASPLAATLQQETVGGHCAVPEVRIGCARDPAGTRVAGPGAPREFLVSGDGESYGAPAHSSRRIALMAYGPVRWSTAAFPRELITPCRISTIFWRIPAALMRSPVFRRVSRALLEQATPGGDSPGPGDAADRRGWRDDGSGAAPCVQSVDWRRDRRGCRAGLRIAERAPGSCGAREAQRMPL